MKNFDLLISKDSVFEPFSGADGEDNEERINKFRKIRIDLLKDIRERKIIFNKTKNSRTRRRIIYRNRQDEQTREVLKKIIEKLEGKE